MTAGVLDAPLVEDTSTLDEHMFDDLLQCVNEDEPATVCVSMRCCGKSSYLGDRCLERARRHWVPVALQMCPHCRRMLMPFGEYDDAIEVRRI